jgi:hypothetical protein
LDWRREPKILGNHTTRVVNPADPPIPGPILQQKLLEVVPIS